jgi:hypothetical protein
VYNPNKVDARSARRIETNLKKGLASFLEYHKKALKSGQEHDQKWLARVKLDLENELQHAIARIENLVKNFQKKVGSIIRKVKKCLE